MGALLLGASLSSAFAQSNQYYDTAQANLGWSSSSSVLDWSAAAGTPPYSNPWTNGNVAVFEGTAGAVTVDSVNPPTVGGIQPTVTGYTLSGGPINWVNGGNIYFPSNNVTNTINSVIADSSGACSVIASGGAGVTNIDVELNGLNTFSGGFTLDGCSVGFNTLDIGGNPSSFGAGTGAIQFGTGGSDTNNSTANYTGNGGGTDRSIQIATMGNAAIKSSGFGAILFTNTGNVVAGPVGPRSLTLAGNFNGSPVAPNIFAETINDLGTGPNVTQLTINGGGWFLPTSNSYSGGTFLGGSSTLYLTNDTALGSPGGGITWAGYSHLTAINGGAPTINDVTLSSTRTITLLHYANFKTPDTNNLIVAAYITGAYITGTNSSANSVIKDSSSYALGILRFTCDTNDYKGDVSLGYGNTEFTSVANQGTPSSLGAGTNIISANSSSAGMLRYIGTNTSCSTTRPLNWTATTGGITLDASGGGVGSSTSAYTIAYLNPGPMKTGSGSSSVTLQGSNNGTNTLGQCVNDSGGTTRLSKNGYGQWLVTGTNIFSGATAIQQGTLTVSTINSVSGGAASSCLGHPTTVANGTIGFGSTFRTGILNYTGPGETSDRVINLAGTTGGATLMQSGSGLLKFTSALTAAGIGSKTLTLTGSAAGAGEIAGAIVDNPSSGTTVTTAAFNLGDTNISLASVVGIAPGASISGTGIPASDTVLAVNPLNNVVTLGVAASAAGTSGETITVTGVKNVTSLAKSGTGTWTLSSANTFSGGTVISGGTLSVGADNNLGAAPGSATNNITINGGALSASASFTLNANRGIALGPTGTNSLGSPLNGNGTLDVAGGQTLSYAGVIASGTTANAVTTFTNIGNLFKTGAGAVVLSGANTYTGNTTINGGTLELVQATLAANSTVAVTNGAVLKLDFAVTNTVASLVLNGVSQSPGVYNSANSSPYLTGSGSLQVASVGPSGPTLLTNSVSGGSLSLSWPAGQGWRLQMQTNSLSAGLGTNWVYVTDGSTASTNILIDASKPTVFYRLTYP